MEETTRKQGIIYFWIEQTAAKKEALAVFSDPIFRVVVVATVSLGYEVGLSCLRHFGVLWPFHDDDE